MPSDRREDLPAFVCAERAIAEDAWFRAPRLERGPYGVELCARLPPPRLLRGRLRLPALRGLLSAFRVGRRFAICDDAKPDGVQAGQIGLKMLCDVSECKRP